VNRDKVATRTADVAEEDVAAKGNLASRTSNLVALMRQ
jgi:hypothetical protein